MVKTKKDIYNYVMNDAVWKCDLPQFLEECQLCTNGSAYDITWNLLRRILVMLTERAIELDDPVLNIIMLNLSLYESSHSQSNKDIITKLRKKIKLL